MKTSISLSSAVKPETTGRAESTGPFGLWTSAFFRPLFAFSLVEILVTVALLSFIVLGLLAMFQQTQRAFRSSMTQTDVLEGGRAVTDMIARDLGQMTPFRGSTNINFYAQLPSAFFPPLTQGMPGTSLASNPNGPQLQRTNVVQTFYFLTQNNLDWVGIGYAVIPLYANSGVGTLYRFVTNGPRTAVWTFNLAFQNAVFNALRNPTNSTANFQRVADGVLHASIRPFAPNGFPILSDRRTPRERQFPRGIFRLTSTNGLPLLNNLNNPVFTNVLDSTVMESLLLDQLHVDCFFTNRAVPASVELELGMLEPPVLDRYKSIGNSTAAQQSLQRQFLSNHVAQVHIFRQRVSVPNVDLNAYQ